MGRRRGSGHQVPVSPQPGQATGLRHGRMKGEATLFFVHCMHKVRSLSPDFSDKNCLAPCVVHSTQGQQAPLPRPGPAAGLLSITGACGSGSRFRLRDLPWYKRSCLPCLAFLNSCGCSHIFNYCLDSKKW